MNVYEEASKTKGKVLSMTIPDASDPLRRVVITEAYLEDQARDQTEYYINYQ